MLHTKKQAFTLVELIVVITILAILGTIAFISLQGYSADARNSKRTQDLNNIAAAINIKTVQGSSLLSFVEGLPTTFTGSISGTGTTAGTDFNEGNVNHTALGIKAEDFQDPNGSEYQIGVTTKKNGQFELAGINENGSGAPTAAVTGTYNARGTGSVVVAKNGANLSLEDNTNIGSFFVGDFVSVDSTDTREIVRISTDGTTLTLASAPTTSTGTGTVALLDAEMGGLVESTTAGTSVTNNGSDLPY
ncbi:prepilin-type N-terminal cleavage/methylation domain-containing protein [Candidatus Gracilibacteria bacterium]|nr:prepilin-type N-terminal cleavage/methylation domain-containing protein [Candidatus Gracilibacteria bacterium]